MDGHRALDPHLETTRLASCSIAKRLVNWHGSHMKATGNPWGVSSWRICVFYLKVLVPGRTLILDHSDVMRGRFCCHLSFGCLGQLFELTLLATSSEGATP